MIPYHISGIGIDDTFVMLGAWRRTSIHSSVPDRMAIAFTDAAVSITITSITDMLSFWIGVITPFPCVKIFCIYTGKKLHSRCLYFSIFKFIISIFSNNIFILIVGTCVVFTYLWHITFFGACMAIAGYAEKDNRHAMTCLRVVPKSLASKLISCENVKNDNIGYKINISSPTNYHNVNCYCLFSRIYLV